MLKPAGHIFGAIAVLALLCGPALSQDAPKVAPQSPLPLKPGQTRLTTRPPNPSNWNVRRENQKVLYVCKPLACADNVVVTIVTGPSPTRNPNPQALERYAKIDFPKQMKALLAADSVMQDRDDKLETLTAKVSSLLGYPAVLNESKLLRGKGVTFSSFAIIFAKSMMITISSASRTREVAAQMLTDFLAGMRVEDAPSGSDVPGKA